MSRSQEYRPKVNLPDTKVEGIYDTISLMCVVLLIFATIGGIAYLPDRIPIHWNLAGEADGYGGKMTILLIPVMSVLFYIGFAYIVKRPHTFNYLQKLTPENYKEQYLNARKLLRIVHIISQIIFVIIVGFMLRGAFGEEQDIPSWFIIVMLFTMIVISIIYAYRSVGK